MTVRTATGQFTAGVHAWRPPQPHWEKSWLEERYVVQKKSLAEIAEEVGCTWVNIKHWLKKHGIPRRTISEARAVKHWGSFGPANPMHGKCGSLNPRFIDGSSPERQRLYVQAAGKAFLKAVYERDNWRCVRCNSPDAGPRSLHAHHIKPWAGNPDLRFDINNAVTLCRTCHQWVHSRKNVAREYLA